MKIKENKKGFTLLELIVVIAIIGIMTSVGLVSLSSSKRQTALKAAQAEVTSAIKLAQSYALQGKSVPGISGICGYGFRFIDNSVNSAYEIFYYTMSGANCTENKSINQVESQNLKNGVSLSSLVSDTEIYFSIPSATLYNSAGAIWPGGTFSFTLGETRTITISSSGLVTEN